MLVQVKRCVRCDFILPLSAYTPHWRSRGGYQAACKVCESERQQIRKHGVTSLDKERIAEAQGGCAVCHRPEPGRKGWVVDHDRKCCPTDRSCVKCRRGVLCQWCNCALGYAQDDPQVLIALAQYLRSGNRLPIPSWESASYERDARDELTKRTEEFQPSLTSGDARAHVQEIR